MFILGLNSGYNLPYENLYNAPFAGYNHDTSACLLKDGEVVCAYEEERLTRIKHTNAFPLQSIKACLDYAGISMQEIDAIAFMGEEKHHNQELMKHFFYNQHFETNIYTFRQLIKRNFETAFGEKLDEKKIHFTNHHVAHACSSYYMSGFKDSLVIAIDGYGDAASGMIFAGENNELKLLHSMNEFISLGNFYGDAIAFLGYSIFDEYKVMGLAPYGNDAKYKKVFNKLYKLLPGGQYETYPYLLNPIFVDIFNIRKKGEEFTQDHMDFAAGLQQATENIFLHIVHSYQQKTGLKNLCLSGGVAQNCTINGKIYYAGIFDGIFIQPAAGDAGGSIGAAINTAKQLDQTIQFNKQQHTYLGKPLADDSRIEKTLKKYASFLDYRFEGEIVQKTADMLTEGKIIGWVQGRSEFGPRALGNRSIIADPCPAKNKDIINKMVKKRESYRPFAPSVLSEYVDAYFKVPNSAQEFDYMNIVLSVKEDKREQLGAVTHVDGSARVQTIQKRTNPLYWSLVKAFHDRTGVPILLNTSFNNNAEPIVDSCEDAIICYLTTDLDYLVIGNYIVSRKEDKNQNYSEVKIGLPCNMQLQSKKQQISNKNIISLYEIYNISAYRRRVIDEDMYCFLQACLTGKKVGEIAEGYDEQTMEKIYCEIKDLWKERYLVMKMEES